MLIQLHIENVAVIDEADIQFEKGLNILTGETGAGKSIIIDSINMVLGERTSRDLIRSGEDKAVVEALFYINSKTVETLLQQNGLELDEDKTLVISREIISEGRNVCRINGRIVTSSILKEVGKNIINIHGQHDNQALLQWENHISFLDKYAGEMLFRLKEEYAKLYGECNRIKSEIRKISGDEHEKSRKVDMLQFQLNEIDGAKLLKGEEDELQLKIKLLSNAEKLMLNLSNTYDSLYGGVQDRASARDNISIAKQELEGIMKLDPQLEKYHNQLDEIGCILDELIYDIRDYRDKIEYDPAVLESLEQRMDLIYRLKRKYGTSVEEILKYRDKIEEELDEILSSEQKLSKLNSQLDKYGALLMQLADKISAERNSAAEQLQKKIMVELKDLDMSKTNFAVRVETEYDSLGKSKLSQQGYDRVEFLISTNPGEPLKPLAKIASGGEMSRIMLAIKTVLADADEVNTLIFDEIDNGVSGRAAQKVAEKLCLIADKKQVLCITHLPQIASMADHHYLIEKNVIDQKSHTTIKRLDAQERKKEVARIVGGVVMTELTLKHAEEMINLASEVKKKRGISKKR